MSRSWRSPNPYFYKVTQTLRLHVHTKELQIVNISLDVLHIFEVTRRWNSPNPYFYKRTRAFGKVDSRKPLYFLAKTNEMTTTTRPWLGTFFRDTLGEKYPTAYFRPSRQTISRHWSDVSCVRCVRCGCWVLGLDSRWGPPLRSGFHPQPPTYPYA